MSLQGETGRSPAGRGLDRGRTLPLPGEAGPPPFPRAGRAAPRSPPAHRAISATLARGTPPPRAERGWPSSGMRLPPETCWLLLWLPPLAAQPVGAERGEEEAAAVSGNRG